MTHELDQAIRGRVWKFGDSISSVVISPMGRYETFEELKKVTMSAVKPDFPQKVRAGDIIVAGRNFGCGSNSPDLVVVLREVGIRAIVAESLARTYFRSGVALGFPLFVAPGVPRIVEEGEELEIDYRAGVARNARTGAQVKLTKYPPSIERFYQMGGLLPMLVQRYREEAAKQQP